MTLDELVHSMIVQTDTFGRAEIIHSDTGCTLWNGNLSFRPVRGEQLWVDAEAWNVDSSHLNFYSSKMTHESDRALLRIFVSKQQ